MKERSSAKLGTVPIPKLIFQVSLPIAISSTVHALYNIVDGIYVSSIGEDALAATSLFFSVNMIMVAVTSGMSAGLNALLSYTLGKKQNNRSAEIIVTGVFLSIVMAVIFAAAGLFGSKAYYGFFGASETVSRYGVEYMTICTVFFLPSALSHVFERVLQATNHASLSMAAQMSGAMVNIILDPILIFGKFGLPAMGVRGAAIATVLGQTVAAGLSILFNILKNEEFKFPRTAFRIKFSTIVDIYRVGLPVSVMQLIGTVMTFSINKILMMFSSTAVTVFGIYYKVQMFVFMQIFAFGQGSITIIAFNRGARRFDRIRETIRSTIIINIVIALLGMLVFQCFTDQLISLFNPTPELLVMARHALRTISMIFPLEAVCVSLSYAFQGLSHGGLSLVHSFVRQLIFRVPFAYLFAVTMGLNAVWYAFCIAEVAALILTCSMYAWIRKKELLPAA